MASRTKRIKLSEYRQDGAFKGYRRFIGGRNFSLGSKKEVATEKVSVLLKHWERCRLRGFTRWPKEALQQALEAASDAALPALVTPPVRAEPLSAQKPAIQSVTVGTAYKAFIKELQERVEAGTITLAHRQSQEYRLGKSVDAPVDAEDANAFTKLRDVVFEHLTPTVIRKAVLWLVQRPVVTKPNCKAARMSYSYAASCTKSLKWFLEWADKRDFWTKPKSFEDHFRVAPVLTLEERREQLEQASGAEPPCFSVDQLAKLYAKANFL